MDRISNLPSGIIETILCRIPIQEAARTSILSMGWRYRWTDIPKLAFYENKFEVAADEAELSVLERTFDMPSKRKEMTKRCKLFYAIYQVLLMHQGPILKFTLDMEADGSCVEIDHILLHLSKKNTVEKLRLDLKGTFTIPLSLFSLHKLRDLYLTGCALDHRASFSGFGSLTTLHLEEIWISEKALLRLLSNCPSLKRLTLRFGGTTINFRGGSTIADFFKCLPVIEYLSVWFHILLMSDGGTISDRGESTIADLFECLRDIVYLSSMFFIFTCFSPNRLPKQVSATLVHLKCLCMEWVWFRQKYSVPFLVLLIRSSPNLEKLTLEMSVHDDLFDESVTSSFILEDYLDITTLEHLNKLEILNFCNYENDLVVVKLLLAKSPGLKNVRILLWDELDKDEKLEISKTILSFTCASPVMAGGATIDDGGDSTIADLFECLPDIEYLSLFFFIYTVSIDDFTFDESEWGSFILEDYSDVRLEHLNELEFLNFSNEENELVVVKLILAKSPVLKNVRIVLWDELDKEKKFKIPEIILSLPCASPMPARVYPKMDRISKLPPGIIETILCLLPIQEAVRTSILSREWRYQWITIPKLEFIQHWFEELLALEQTFSRPSKRKTMSIWREVFYVIYQVLLMHQGPIHEFTLSIPADGSCLEIDHIILHLSKKNTVKILTINLSGKYRLPLSFFSLHQLTELHLSGCILHKPPSSIGFASLTTLDLQEIWGSEKDLLGFLSCCPLLKRFTLMTGGGTIDDKGDFTIADLFECLPVIEYLSLFFFIYTCFAPHRLPKELPTTLVHLKYVCMDYAWFRHKYSVPFLVLLIRSSPNLEKLKLEVSIDDFTFDESEWSSFVLEDYSDVTLEHLNELEFINFSNEDNELVVVKLILAKSPVLKNVRILLWDELENEKKLQIPEIILSLPCASPMMSDESTIDDSGDSTLADFFQCLPVIEYLCVFFFIYLLFVPDKLSKELQTTMVHLKYLCMEYAWFRHKYSVPFLVLMIRSSPNLEKLKLTVCIDDFMFDESEWGSFVLEGYSNVTLEHLNELEFINFSNEDNELVVVKLILAKSPVLKNVRIVLWDELDNEKKLQIPEIILSLPCASPVISVDDFTFDESEWSSFILEDYSDITLEHLNELELLDFSNEENELVVVKLILARSPVLKNVRIQLWDELHNKKKLRIPEIISSLPCASPMMSDGGTIDFNGDSTIVDLFKCLPVIEYLYTWFFIFMCFAPSKLPKELPTTLVHLKYLCMKWVWFKHKYSVPFLVLLIRSSPNLEKLKLEMSDENLFDESETISFILEDYTDIMLEHLNELEIIGFGNEDNELVVVKLILAKSPVLKNVRILLWDGFDKDDKLEISETILSFPCASPSVKIIVS
ncbi:hypothetical protein SSX86_000659 [Deinandra increscens subsp. villosa]|uniref:FBD domain-containing protein n=1 Tax=Deinandra increscens subsp. villosa TaxID=3103831 RepID=A0AAP0HDT4_9ASTR